MRSGLIVLREEGQRFVPVAIYPDDLAPADLVSLAEETLRAGTEQVISEAGGPLRIGYPLADQGVVVGAVVVWFVGLQPQEVPQHLDMIRFGAGWLLSQHRNQEVNLLGARLRRSAFLLDLLTELSVQAEEHTLLLSLVNRLSKQFNCQQVVFGESGSGGVAIRAMSDTAWFDKRSNLLRRAEQVISEAIDEGEVVCQSARDDVQGATSVTMYDYLVAARSSAACVVPIRCEAETVGGVLLERLQPFSEEERQLLATVGLAVGPLLKLHQRADQPISRHIREVVRGRLGALTGSSHSGIKLVAAVVALLAIVLSLVRTDYRVSSIALVEGAVQRAAVAPFDGFLREAPVRAGDVVRRGQVLARLEDKDLQLERTKWAAELEVAQRKEREAMAAGDRVALRLAAAQGNQARAQLDLAVEKLNRVDVVAPFDGVVVRGDLSQQLGSPLERGKLLFEIAPLDAWRIVLKVDERDIDDISLGKEGEMVLNSLPGHAYPLRVSKVTPVSIAEDGRNYFRVEAELTASAERIRPGMEGVGKVLVEPRPILWIWTHRLTQWVRVSLWKLWF
jgi:multidrug resistance efflux pump